MFQLLRIQFGVHGEGEYGTGEVFAHGEITGAVAENSQIIDVRGVAFEHTVDLLRKAAGK